MEMIATASGALITTNTLLAAFLAAGVFTNANLVSGVPQGLFNSLCLFLAALYLSIGNLIYAKAPLAPLTKDQITRMQQSSGRTFFSNFRNGVRQEVALIIASFNLFAGGILLIAGLSVFLLQVVCVQFDTRTIPNCRTSSIGITVWFAIVLVLALFAVIWDYVYWFKELKKYAGQLVNGQ